MSALTGWPFWAPSDLAAVEAALDLAGLAAGERLVDLGCGDGQVLVAAARRGAVVAGVECDEELVERARRALAENGLAGEVTLGDVFEFDLDGTDVVFTYLAPATLQRLAPRIQELDGARLVTVDFAVPNLAADATVGQNSLYRLPATAAQAEAGAWQTPAALVAITPLRHSLTCLSFVHPGGDVAVTADGLDGALAFVVGADRAEPGEQVAVDLRWEELDEGTFVRGTLSCEGAGSIAVYGLVTEEEDGLWEVTAEGVDRLEGRLRSGWVPTTFADLLAACEED